MSNQDPALLLKLVRTGDSVPVDTLVQCFGGLSPADVSQLLQGRSELFWRTMTFAHEHSHPALEDAVLAALTQAETSALSDPVLVCGIAVRAPGNANALLLTRRLGAMKICASARRPCQRRRLTDVARLSRTAKPVRVRTGRGL